MLGFAGSADRISSRFPINAMAVEGSPERKFSQKPMGMWCLAALRTKPWLQELDAGSPENVALDFFMKPTQFAFRKFVQHTEEPCRAAFSVEPMFIIMGR